ncbi:MAG: hypothetical protein HUJ94_01430, partial [Bacteroidales bacterium]|nr:hypothetical protein [Bacteroidales bacterium]
MKKISTNILPSLAIMLLAASCQDVELRPYGHDDGVAPGKVSNVTS